MLIITIIAIFFLFSASMQYKMYSHGNKLAYGDAWGSLGGFISGFLASCVLLPRAHTGKRCEQTIQSVMRVIGIVGLSLWTIGWTCLFIFVSKPAEWKAKWTRCARTLRRSRPTIWHYLRRSGR